MINRLVHHGHLLMFESQSYRMTHALMRHTEGPGTNDNDKTATDIVKENSVAKQR